MSMTARASIPVSTLALAAALITLSADRPAILVAQQVGSTSAGLTLQAAVDATIAGNTQIRNGWLQVESARGDALSRSSPFDFQLHASVQQDRANEQIEFSQFTSQQETAYQIAATRQLRSGITLSPSVQVTGSHLALAGAPANGLASATMGVTVPLLYDRGGAVSAAAERVGQLDLQTVRDNWNTSVVNGVSASVTAYWGYVAAVARLDAQLEAETRATRLLDQTTQLVEKQERAPADLQQLRANVASKRSARILAEQSVVEARVQLGTSMGVDAAQVMTLAAPSTAFPQPPSDGPHAASAAARLLDTAMERRPELVAQRVNVQALQLELHESQNGTLPRLDLMVSLGYLGYAEGTGDHLISPLYRNVPGLNATVQLRYDISPTNSSARGRVMQEQAGLDQQRGGLRDVERQVATDVQTAAQGVDRAALALQESQSAVTLFRTSVDNEQRKLQLGVNTLFDVLNAEDALTNALLNVVNNQRTYAVALAELRVATGTLVYVVDGAPRVDATRLIATP